MNFSKENQSAPAPRFASIRDTAARTGLSQFYLRQRCYDCSIPFLKAGSKYFVDVEGLLEQLETEAQQNVEG